MSTHVKVLESAVADCGWWRWWTADLPRVFQIELGGAQLWSPPPSPDLPPSGVIAVRLFEPKKITLLARGDAESSFDWFGAIHRDEIEPFGVSSEKLTFSSHGRAAAFAAEATSSREWWRADDAIGDVSGLVPVAFWAGRVGLSALCGRIEVASMRGPLSPDAIVEAHAKWWAYWREYWSRKDGPDPLPEDFACEVCIPVAGSAEAGRR